MPHTILAPKATLLWNYFLLDSSQLHIARCNNSGKGKGKEGKEGATKLNNGGMIAHLENILFLIENLVMLWF